MLWVIVVVVADNLHWEDPNSGAVFDLSVLRRE